jgi:Domain of Unknown Function (DUF1080)
MKIRFALFLSLLFAGLASNAIADRATSIQPKQSKLARQIVDEKYSDSQLHKTWTVNKGDWQINNGVLVGKEKASDQHAAVLTYSLPNRDSAVQFSFKSDGAKSFNLSLNHAKGHLFRVILAPNGVVLSKDKDKKDPKSKIETLAKAEAKFETGKWYTILVEIEGEKVTAQTDNGIKIEGSHADLNVDKTGYRFVTSGESVSISDFKVWELAK